MYEEEKGKKEKFISSFAFFLLAWEIGLMEMLLSLARVDGTWKEDQYQQFPTAEWFPGTQTGPGGHFKLQSGISRVAFWKKFLAEISSE